MQGISVSAKIFEMTGRAWVRFGIIIIVTVICSLVITAIVWKRVGKELSLVGPYLDIDFFNLLCAVFGIIGLGITLFQITQIRSEQQIKDDTAAYIHGSYFKLSAARPVADSIGELQKLQSLINSTSDYNKASLTSFLERINKQIYVFDSLKQQQISLGCGTIIDCEKCLILLKELQGSLARIIEENLYSSFPRQSYNQKMTEIVSHINQCDSRLKSNVNVT